MSTPTTNPATESPVASPISNPNFTTSNCGQAIGAATGGPLYSGGGDLILNGNTDLSSCICGSASDAYVQRIYIEPRTAPVYHYEIHVFGRGPAGFGARMDLEFTMAGGETASLSLASTTPEDHFVKVRTDGLVQFTWNA